jgi:hypothetical protein
MKRGLSRGALKWSVGANHSKSPVRTVHVTKGLSGKAEMMGGEKRDFEQRPREQ